MTDDKIAVPSGGSPRAPTPGSLTRWDTAYHKWKLLSPRFRAAAAGAFVSTVVLVSFSVAKAGIAPRIVSTMAVLASLVTILGLFDVKIREFPSLSRRAAGGLIYLILVMNVLAGTGWGISSYHQAHRAVDVLAMITISRNIDLRPDGAPATLDAPITAQRDDIVLVFQAVDHNPEGGICTPFAEFLVTRRLSGNATAPVAAAPGRPVRVDLPRGGTNVHLEIALKDARQLRNCGVDLRVTSVKLANR